MGEILMQLERFDRDESQSIGAFVLIFMRLETDKEAREGELGNASCRAVRTCHVMTPWTNGEEVEPQ
jgi:hypothetical protein